WNDTAPAGPTSNAVSFATTSRFNIYNNNNTDNPLNQATINSYKDDSGNLNIYTIDDVYRSGSTGNRPTGIQRGFIYYDTTIQNPVIWTGSAWELMARGATTGQAGLIEIATSQEITDGVDNTVAV